MEFLIELMTEEMPLSHVESGLSQLKEKFLRELISKRLINENGHSGNITVYGTCRRLIMTGDIAPNQPDLTSEITGPPKAAAFDSQGKPTQAAIGFARSKGVDAQDLVIIKNEKGEYAGIKKVFAGKPSTLVLAEIFPKIISSLSFPKMMKWGESSFRFSRPLKNICCIFNGKRVDFEVGGLSSSPFTFGHALLSPKKIKVTSFSGYEKDLLENKVMISLEKRKDKILSQINRRLKEHEAKLLEDDILLNKLANDIEWPFVILGQFPDAFLKLPLEILSTAMRKGQNLFSVMKGKKQLPFFIGVGDAVNDKKGLIRKGNERVLKARLEDARFFWNQDKKVSLKKKQEGLKEIIDQKQLGNYSDKVLRIRKIVFYMVHKLDLKPQKRNLAEAAELCKVDLLTDMVREFPSLQGIVGGLYSKEENYNSAIWKAIYEHYLPAGLTDRVPSTMNGQILSVADKLDSVVGLIGSGVFVSGSKDPFGIRRNAQGVCRIIIEKKINLSLTRLIEKVISVYGDNLKLPKEEIKSNCLKFFNQRLKHLFSTQNYRYDMIDASLSPGIDNIYYSYLRIVALDHLKESPQYEPMILIAKRINNIVKNHPRYKIKTEYLLEKEERDLHSTYTIIEGNVIPLLKRGEFLRAQKMIFRMHSTIDLFFEKIMVMCDEKNIRRNRLALLQEISGLISLIADFSKIVVSEK